MTITRSTGQPLNIGSVTVALAGGGYSGITADLDQLVASAADALAAAYGTGVEIRFNTDRESGKAFAKTADGTGELCGIGGSLITDTSRDRVRRAAVRELAEASTGRATWQDGPMTYRQRAGACCLAIEDWAWLERHPAGQLTIMVHIRQAACTPALRGELADLDGWWDMGGQPSAYHCGPARSLGEALERCLRYVPAVRGAGG